MTSEMRQAARADTTSGARPTMREIAKRAGVSLITVSRVLNGRPDVSDVTRASVLHHARVLGYGTAAPRLSAAHRTGLVALTVPFIRDEGGYFSEIVMGAAEALFERGASLVLCPTRREHDREVSPLGQLLPGRVDGAVLISPSESPEELEALHVRGHLFVVITPTLPLFEDILVVTGMSAGGGRAAVDHLVVLGHRRIAIITGPLR